ncbi:EpsG family protein [Vibrio parahaemolyticus]|uniref:Polysaccharide polymerase n=2 Tax=Vibrio parahaemolyticus TaxID=670 RepID=A0A5P4S886_VIBPH|nr:EpsG family protein [Vibrio parahaemolyticus]EGQ8128972.1 EpsG family protein [Vibrio parahaemolyticus]EGQ8278583.1 hypothetical protein [Vibrio parahaemolyticus]EGQ8717347.1 hypothetical protein [Vibrio parahaemolyticus]EGQ8810739.1 hypothetical protein [Vibrio parahaemolyticus]EGQ8864356.1 hypothetical protein [Vibrio parahaemolyticus]
MLKLLDILLLISFLSSVLIFHRFEFFKKIIWFNLAALFLMLTFRSTGVDLENYRSFYAGDMTEVHFSIEPIWFILRDTLKSFGVPFHLFIFFSLLPFFYSLIRVYREGKVEDMNLVLFAFLILFYFHAVSGIRAFGASAFFILATLNYSQRNRFSYIISACFSTLSHSSGIMAFAIPIIAKIKFTKQSFIFFLLFAIICGIILQINVDILMKMSTDRSNVFEESIFKLVYYLSYKREFDSVYNGIYLDLIYAVRMIVSLLLAIILINLKSLGNDFYTLIRNVVVCTVVVSFFFYAAGAPVIATRIFDLNCVTAIFLSAYLFDYRKSNNVIFIIFVILYFVMELLMNAGIFSSGSPFYLGF